MHDGQDVLSDALQAMRVTGSVVMRSAIARPWGVTVPPSAELAQLAAESGVIRACDHRTQALSFHVMERGHCRLRVHRGPVVELSAGDLVILLGGHKHTLSPGMPRRVLPLAEAMEQCECDGLNLTMGERDAIATQFLCGVFLLQDARLNPLFAALPGVIHLQSTSPDRVHGPRLETMLRFLREEAVNGHSGRTFVMARIIELLWAEAVRGYMAGIADGEAGWLRALTEPVICRALEKIHQHPGADWTVAELARHVGLSRSRFSTRFAQVVGDSPLSYLTQWRMVVAGRMLETSDDSIAHIATSVGYASEAAFSRVFKRHTGAPPARWRKSRRAPVPAAPEA